MSSVILYSGDRDDRVITKLERQRLKAVSFQPLVIPFGAGTVVALSVRVCSAYSSSNRGYIVPIHIYFMTFSQVGHLQNIKLLLCSSSTTHATANSTLP